MSSPLQDESFDVLHGILHEKNKIFPTFTDPANAKFLAAILGNITVIAEKTPSGFFMSKVSRSQNKCQKSYRNENVRVLNPLHAKPLGRYKALNAKDEIFVTSGFFPMQCCTHVLQLQIVLHIKN